MWWVFGWAAGVLSLMQMQVWKVRHERRNPLQINPNFIPMDERLAQEWDVKELVQPDPFLPTPRAIKPVVMQECPRCGKAFRRVNQHIRLAHPVSEEIRTANEETIDGNG